MVAARIHRRESNAGGKLMLQRATSHGSRTAPLRFLTLGAFLALVTVGAAVRLATDVPWLGAGFVSASGEGAVRIAWVAPHGPSAGILRPGERVVAIARSGGAWIPVDGSDLMAEPGNFPAFETYNEFMARQGRLAAILTTSPVKLRLASGRAVEIAPASQRSPRSLPVGFWLLNGFGVFAFLIAVSVWGLRDPGGRNLPGQLLAVSGTVFLVAAAASSIYVTRELALDPWLFRTLELANDAAILLFSAAGASLLWCYPRRLTRFPFHYVLFGWSLLVWLNVALQKWDIPGHNVYVPLLANYLFALIFASAQMRMTRGRPIERAALKWLLLAVFLSAGVAQALFFVPVIFGHAPLSSPVEVVGVGLIMYVGLALGVARYRLFDLERWWFEIWLWFFAGLGVVGLDASIALFLGVEPMRVLGLAVILIAWLYLPVRQRLWRLLGAESMMWWEQHLPEMLESSFNAPSRAEFVSQWQLFLRRAFRPLQVESSSEPAARACLVDSGARLRLPGLAGGEALDLVHAQRGSRLFTTEDVKVANGLLAIASRSLEAWDIRDRSIRRERKRIMRELHDDVASRLLTLVHRCRDPRNSSLAGTALASLRDAIHSLDPTVEQPVADALSDWRAEVAERLEESPVRLEWKQTAMESGWMLDARLGVNLRRILQEAVTNALRHARPAVLEVMAGLHGASLVLDVANDGLEERSEAPRAGHGLRNIRARAREMGGEASYSVQAAEGIRRFVLRVAVPLIRTGRKLDDEAVADSRG